MWKWEVNGATKQRHEWGLGRSFVLGIYPNVLAAGSGPGCGCGTMNITVAARGCVFPKFGDLG